VAKQPATLDAADRADGADAIQYRALDRMISGFAARARARQR